MSQRAAVGNHRPDVAGSSANERGGRVETRELQAALQESLNARHLAPRRMARLERTPSRYGSSFPLEELTVFFDDGEPLNLMFKDVSPHALSPAARRAKPAFLDDPLREIEVYRSLLDSRRLGTPVCYGSVVDETGERYWLFLEKVAGRELYQVGEFEIWQQVARWLADLHSGFGPADRLPPNVVRHLVRHDASYYERWLERALAFVAERTGCTRDEDAQRLQRLARHYPGIVRELLALPTSLIHGEFYASNVIVQEAPGALRVCVVDWERAAIGPGLVDLAALTAGKWSEAQKVDLAMEYYAGLPSPRERFANPGELLRGLHLCRLHLAVQWLGWSRDWSPPREHRQDWLTEAVEAADKLGHRL